MALTACDGKSSTSTPTPEVAQWDLPGPKNVVLEIEIEPEMVPQAECGGLTNFDGCMVMHGPDGRQYLHWGIKGFSYEEGYTWTLKVRRTKKEGPIQTESPGYTYTLLEVISKVPVE